MKAVNVMQNTSKQKTQSDKFKALARELECDEDETAFDEKLKRVAKQEPPRDDAKEKPADKR